MRKIIIILLLFLLNISCSIYIPTEEEKSINKVINIPNQTKNELYIKVNRWFVKTFNSSESVIEFRDKGSGIVSGKYVFKDAFYNIYYKQLIEVQIKDNKVKISIGQLYMKKKSSSSSSFRLPGLKYYYSETRTYWIDIISSLESYLKENNDDDF